VQHWQVRHRQVRHRRVRSRLAERACDPPDLRILRLPAGYASEDGVGLHYVGADLAEAVTIVPGKRPWWVEAAPNGGLVQHPLEPRLI